MNICFEIKKTKAINGRFSHVQPVLRFVIWSLWIVVALGTFASCMPKHPIPRGETAINDDIRSGDAEPLEPEVTAEPSAQRPDLSAEEKSILLGHNGLLFDLNLHNNADVEQFFFHFNHNARKTFSRWLERSEPYLPYIRQAFTENGLPQDLVLLPFSESGYNPRAYSRAGAAGLWQFMPYTARKYGLKVDWWVDERRDPYLSTGAAIRYLSDLHDMFGDWHLALAAYNAGEGKISRALQLTGTKNFFDLVKHNHQLSHRQRLKRETIQYVPKFIAISKIYMHLQELGFTPVSWDSTPATEHVKVPGGTDLMAMAQAGGMRWSEFHELNPHYRRQVSPPNAVTTAHIPEGNLRPILAYIDKPTSRPYTGYLTYMVRNGDSWWNISRKFDVPISVLKKVNNRKSNILHAGQTVMVPGGGSAKAVRDADASESRSVRNKKAHTAQNSKSYKVQRNDTLWSLSRNFGVSVKAIQQANNMRNHSRLRVGQQLIIPGKADSDVAQKRAPLKTVAAAAKTTSPHTGSVTKTVAVTAQDSSYKVCRGDTLYSIANRYGCSPADLRKWNHLGRSNNIYAGQQLTVSGN